jgi:acyl-CoA thioesterase-1
MNLLIYFFASGAAFFGGVVLILAGLSLVTFLPRRWTPTIATLSALVGLVLSALSATPLPYWFYAVAGVASLTWLTAERSRRPALRNNRIWLRAAVLALWLAGCLVEMPYHFTPALQAIGHPGVTVFGDSISAGMGDGRIRTWPHLLAQTHAIEVQDYSRAGATASSLLHRLRSVDMPLGDGIILLEIGGNDLLGSTPVAEFERDLDQLLARLCGPGRVVVLFELPLLPFANEVGRTQRHLAARHRALLLPKRIFAEVLTTEGATTDSLHLSQRGHQLLAEAVWRVLQTAYVD